MVQKARTLLWTKVQLPRAKVAAPLSMIKSATICQGLKPLSVSGKFVAAKTSPFSGVGVGFFVVAAKTFVGLAVGGTVG